MERGQEVAVTTEAPEFELIGDDSMPARIFGFLAPSEPPTVLVGLAQVAVGVVLAWVEVLPPATKILGIAMFFDYLTGVLAAEVDGSFSRKKGLQGIFKKAVIGVGVILLHWVTVIAGGGDMIYQALTIALSLNEGRSSLSNLRRSGYPLDDIFDAVLSRFEIQNKARVGTATPPKEEEKKDGA